MHIFWIEQEKIVISQFSPPKFRYFADQSGPKGGPYENEFWQFSNGKMSPYTVRARKADEKNAVICLVPELWSLKCQKLCSFCIFFADVSNKSMVVAAVYVDAFECSRFTYLENGIGYYAMAYSLEDISVWRWWISLNELLLKPL